MKIIRLTTFLDFGGIERKMEKLSSWKDEHEWVFVALNKGGAAETMINKNGKRVICLQLPYRIPNLKTIYTLYRLFKVEKPDVVHTAGSEANFHGMIAAKLAGVKVKVAEEIGIPVHSKMARIIFKNIFKIADWVTGESQAVVENLKIKLNIPDSKIKKIYNFINAQPNFNPHRANAANSEFKIISVSRLEPVKNFAMAIRVIKRLVDDDHSVKYLIVGDGTLRKSLEDLAIASGILENIEFVGFKPDPIPYLSGSDLFILTSNNEGFSNSLLEAMYNGVPSLSTRVGGSEDMIIDEKNGWLVDTENEEELYKKLIRILFLTREELEKIGKEGNKTVMGNFTLDNHIAETLKIYKKNG